MSDAATTSTALATTDKKKGAAWVQEFVSRAKGEIKQVVPETVAPYVSATGSAARAYAEAGVTGAVLGAADAMFGPEPGGVPIDGVVSGVALLGAIGSAKIAPGATEDFRTVGAVAFGGLTRRKMDQLISGKRAARGESVHGQPAVPPAKGGSKIHGEGAGEGGAVLRLVAERLDKEPK